MATRTIMVQVECRVSVDDAQHFEDVKATLTERCKHEVEAHPAVEDIYYAGVRTRRPHFSEGSL
jgi:hypothetical protein